MKKQATDELVEAVVETMVAPKRNYFLPTEEVTVEAGDPDEAVEINKSKKDQEVGDDSN